MDLTTTIPDEVAAAHRSAGHWGDEVLVDWARAVADAHPGRIAVADESGSLTYRDLWDAGSRLAGWMVDLGVGRGEVVSVQLPNWREFAVIALAVEMVGGVLNPLLPIYREHELRHIMNTCRTRLYVIPPAHGSFSGFLDLAASLRAAVPSLAGVLVVRPDDTGPGSQAVAYDAALEAGDPFEPVKRGADEPCLVAFTSGTESHAKGCVHTNNTTGFGLRAASQALDLSAGDVLFMPSPLGHATGIQWGLRLAIFLGTTLVLQDRWAPGVAARLIRDHGCTYALAATPFVADLVDHVAAKPDGHDFTRFRMFVSGGAPIPRDLVERTKSTLGADLLACYGQAECFMAVLVRPSDPLEVKAGSDGWPLPGVEVRIVDDAGDDVPAGDVGECWTRGPHVMVGYVNPPPDRERYQPGGWLATGDLVQDAGGGAIRVVGRTKEIIIRGGINISPREIEEALGRHPAVARVAVVGYPDRRLGEKACAFVIPRGAPPTLDDLTDHLRTLGFATYKLPERLEVVDALPMTPSGKVQKVKLQEQLAAVGSDQP